MPCPEGMEGSFGGAWTCEFHDAQLASFATTFLNPPHLFLARRADAEPVLRAILRATDSCPQCRRHASRVEDRQVGLSSVPSGETSPDVFVRVNCTHHPGGRWECSYHADVKRKVLLLGDVSARKTELLRHAVYDGLADVWRDSLGAKVMTRHESMALEDRSVGFHVVFVLYDIAGHRLANKDLLRGYFRGARSILAICDLARDRSVEELGYWLSVAEWILGKRSVVIVARGRTALDPLPISESRLRELAAKHEAVVVTIPPGESHRLEHMFHGLGAEVVHEVFGTERSPPMYV